MEETKDWLKKLLNLDLKALQERNATILSIQFILIISLALLNHPNTWPENKEKKPERNWPRP